MNSSLEELMKRPRHLCSSGSGMKGCGNRWVGWSLMREGLVDNEDRMMGEVFL